MDQNRDSIERRKFIRAQFPCKITLQGGARVLDTVTQNISAGGLRVIVNEEIKELTVVGLELALVEEPLQCKGRVVWALESRGTYDVGIEFYDISDKDRWFLDEFVKRLITDKEGANGK